MAWEDTPFTMNDSDLDYNPDQDLQFYEAALNSTNQSQSIEKKTETIFLEDDKEGLISSLTERTFKIDPSPANSNCEPEQK